MLCEAVMAYNAVRRSMMSGKVTAEVKFGEEAVKYSATSETVKFLLDDIRRLNVTCPSEASRAILGLGAITGPLGVRFGCGPSAKCGC
jgi:predicted Mrr-cat superfamily restriction endonuclease